MIDPRVSVVSSPQLIQVIDSEGVIAVVNAEAAVVIASEGVQGPPGASANVNPALEADAAIFAALIATPAVPTPTRVGGRMASIAYDHDSFSGITGHVKTFIRDGSGQVTQIVESLVYGGDLWTMTTQLFRDGSGNLDSWPNTLTRSPV